MNNQNLAKLQSPVTDHVVIRERLFHLLDQAREKKGVWVTGLPGAGKTTLVASYIAANKIPHAWYHLDSSDADLATFFYYLRFVVKNLTPSQHTKLPHLTPEYLAHIDVYARRYFENLFAMLPKGFVLVFDNYHEINSNPLIHTILSEVLLQVPEHCSVVVISRSQPPEVLMPLQAHGALEIIDREAVKFTLDEVKELVHRYKGKNDQQEDVRKLHSWTDGWAAGLILMLERYHLHDERTLPENMNGYQCIFDYFSSEIFNRLDSDVRIFLLKTCLFPSMSVIMARQISGNNQAGKLLDNLVKSHYFTILRQNFFYQYHDLFKEFLVFKAKEYFSEAQLNQLYLHAATILQENDKNEQALQLFFQAKAWNQIGYTIKVNAKNLISQGRNKLLESWIRRLPGEIISNDPWILYWLGEASSVLNPVQARSYFEMAYKIFIGEETGADGLYLAWCGIIETFIYEYGNFVPIRKWIHRMEDIMKTHGKFPSRELEARVLSLMVYALIHYNPYHPRIDVWAHRILELLKHVKDPEQRLYYLFPVSHYFAWTGKIYKRGSLIELMNTADINLSIRTQLLQKMHHAAYHKNIGDRDTSLQSVSEGLKIAHKSGVHFLDHMIVVQAVYSFLMTGDLKRTEEYLHAMDKTVNRSNALHVIQYDALVGWLEYLKGNSSFAIEKIKSTLELSIKAHIPFAQGLCHIALARIYYKLGNFKNAQDNYKKGLFVGNRMKSKILQCMAYNTQAYRLLYQIKSNNFLVARNLGLSMLKKAIGFSKKYGVLDTYLADSSTMIQLYITALEHNIEVKYVKSIIHDLGLIPENPPVECVNWPWRLKIFTMGHMRILADNVRVPWLKNTHGKLLELLQLLITHYDRSIDFDSISSVLWPDAPGDYAHQTLDVTIHRLRKLLGTGDAILAEAGRLMINPKVCWLDVQAFGEIGTRLEALLQGLDPSIRPADRHARIQDLGSRMLRLYRGDFFAQGPLPPWAIGFRETLRDRFAALVEMLGAYYEKKGDRARAVTVYEKGLNADERKELFYQRLMLLYHAMGRHPVAAALYRRCAAVLIRTLGIEPSRRTREIFERISRRKIRG